ncbi:uncharacterized protein LOC123558907 [Mercenaria mercenaria]|uniref:uncharacterized protein LOC123558907 n=1 Tax=Mercenaria mercenaria TaxID=6596 RepID=UPI00234F2B24|nr:uncharacterized protein LOC123558907 [Mercenaria mercenaria]
MKAAVVFLALLPLIIAKPLVEKEFDFVELQRRVDLNGFHCGTRHPDCMNWYPGDALVKVVVNWLKEHGLPIAAAACNVACAAGSLPLEIASAGLSAGLCTAGCQAINLAG